MNPKKYIAVIIVSGAFLIASIALIVMLFSPDEEPESFVITGDNNLNYSVFYVEDNFIGSGKRPLDFNYIMPYTDYIEVTNGITFKSEPGLPYLLDVIETFSIHYQNGQDNTLIFEDKTVIVSGKNVMPGDFA